MDIPAAFHFTHRRTVEFAETDMAGIVHFSNFFRYVEAAEHAFFRSLGAGPISQHAAGASGWPRIETACQFLRPVRFDDALDIGLRVESLRTTSLTYRFWVFAAAPPERPLCASGTFAIVHVTFDAATRTVQKSPIPAELRTKLESLIATGIAAADKLG